MKKILMTLLGLGIISGAACANPSSMNPATGTLSASQTLAAKNLAKGQAWLAANKTKEGVVTLADGLQYKILTKGTGKIPRSYDRVTVDYVGMLTNGTEFDSSYKRGQSATFPVNGVIPGWTEALLLMPVGSTWELYIPANLAYGKNGAPPAIGPNEALLFKVSLISIN